MVPKSECLSSRKPMTNAAKYEDKQDRKLVQALWELMWRFPKQLTKLQYNSHMTIALFSQPPEFVSPNLVRALIIKNFPKAFI